MFSKFSFTKSTYARSPSIHKEACSEQCQSFPPRHLSAWNDAGGAIGCKARSAAHQQNTFPAPHGLSLSSSKNGMAVTGLTLYSITWPAYMLLPWCWLMILNFIDFGWWTGGWKGYWNNFLPYQPVSKLYPFLGYTFPILAWIILKRLHAGSIQTIIYRICFILFNIGFVKLSLEYVSLSWKPAAEIQAGIWKSWMISKKPVDTIEGPVVIAGPGTSKTQILASRIGKILLKQMQHPENISALPIQMQVLLPCASSCCNSSDPMPIKWIFTPFMLSVMTSSENLSLFEKTALDPIYQNWKNRTLQAAYWFIPKITHSKDTGAMCISRSTTCRPCSATWSVKDGRPLSSKKRLMNTQQVFPQERIHL